LKFLEQCSVEVVIATNHQLGVDGPFLVGRICLGARFSGGVLPLLKLIFAELLAQLLG
jgi:hypothetical protein